MSFFDAADDMPMVTTRVPRVQFEEDHDPIVVVNEDPALKRASPPPEPAVVVPSHSPPSPQVTSSAMSNTTSTTAPPAKARARPNGAQQDDSAQVVSAVIDGAIGARNQVERRLVAVDSSSSFIEVADAVLKDHRELRRQFGYLKLNIAFAVLDALLFRSPIGIGGLEAQALEVLGGEAEVLTCGPASKGDVSRSPLPPTLPMAPMTVD